MSYGLEYIVPFRTLGDHLIEIQILKLNKTGGSPIELLGSGEPLSISFDDEDFLYTPIRTSSCKINIVGSDYLQSLYSTKYKEWKINIYRDKALIWTGFIKPETYTQDYTNKIFELCLEGHSALSTLESIEYVSDEKSYISVWDFLKKIITTSGADYESVYIPETYQKGESNILEKMELSEANFFDEEGVPMMCLETLQELCKFLNWTATDWNGSLTFVDIDFKGKYRKYNRSLSTYELISPRELFVQDLGFQGGNNTLDILGGYNKATVRVDNYEVSQTIGLEEDIEFVEMLTRGFETKRDKPKRYTLKKVYQAVRNSFYLYTKDGHEISFDNYKELSQNEKWLTLGANQVREFNYRVDRDGNEFVEDTKTFSFKDAIDVRERVYTLHGVLWLAFDFLDETKKVAELRSESLFYDKGWLVIDFRLLNLDIDMRVHLDSSKNKYEYLPVSLQIGNYYFDGTRKWTTQFTKFHIPLTSNDTGEKQVKPNKRLFEKPYNVTGYVIPLYKALKGEAKLTIYSTGKQVDKWASDSAGYLLRDIKISYKQEGVIDSKDEEKHDRLYENVVNESFINELEPIDFKISSHNNDGISHSKVLCDEAYLTNNLYSNIYDENIRPEEQLIKRIINQYSSPKIKLTQELKYHTVFPMDVLKDRSIGDKRFSITGGELNIGRNQMTLKMVENG